MHSYLFLALVSPLSVAAAPNVARGNTLPALPGIPDLGAVLNGKCTLTRTTYTAVTSTRKVTLAPRPVTTTIVSTSTSTSTVTLPSETSVFSSTSTLFTTATTTSVTTQTDTVFQSTTITAAPATSTIPAPAGFTPIRSVYPDSAPNKARSLEERGKGKGVALKPSDCKKCTSTAYKTSTIQWTKTRVSIVKGPTPTVTKRQTTTVTTATSILPAPASQTLTFFETTTLVSTVQSTASTTVTSTTTITEAAGPTSTVYGACSPDNILSSYQGKTVGLLVFGPPGGAMSLGSASSAYDCCVKCINNANCAGSGFVAGTCFGLTPDNGCAGNLVSGQFGLNEGSSGGFSVSNGGCGQWAVQAS